MEKLLNNILENNKSFESLNNKDFKHLAIPNIYSCGYQSTQLKSNKTNCTTENNCVDNKLIDTLIGLASYTETTSKKKTRKKQNKSNKSNKRLKKSTTKKRRN